MGSDVLYEADLDTAITLIPFWRAARAIAYPRKPDPPKMQRVLL
jgi:hypothetical protein